MNDKHSPKPAVFLHIQKTAGSSIVDLARLAYGAEEVVSHGDFLLPPKNPDELVTAKGLGINYFGDKQFISGHFGFDFARPLLQTRYSFTFLRDPVERILSFYYFCRQRDPEEFETYALARKLDLDEFLMIGFDHPDPVIKSSIWNNQTWQLANGYGHSNGRTILNFSPEEMLELAIRHLDELSYIGFTETFEQDRNNILRALNISMPGEKIVSNANPGRPTAKDLPVSTLRLLHELTQLDRALYEAAWLKRKKITRKKLLAMATKIMPKIL